MRVLFYLTITLLLEKALSHFHVVPVTPAAPGMLLAAGAEEPLGHLHVIPVPPAAPGLLLAPGMARRVVVRRLGGRCFPVRGVVAGGGGRGFRVRGVVAGGGGGGGG